MRPFDRHATDGVTDGLIELRSAVTDAPAPDVAAEHLDAIFAAQDAAGAARVRAHRTTVAMISGSAVAAMLVVSSIGLRVPAQSTVVDAAAPSIETIEVDVRRAVAARVAGDDPEKPTGAASRTGEVDASVLIPSQSPEVASAIDHTATSESSVVVAGDAVSDAAPAGEATSRHAADEQGPGESGPPAHANGGGPPEPGDPQSTGNQTGTQTGDPDSGTDADDLPGTDVADGGRPPHPVFDADVPLETVLHGAPLESAMCAGLVATIVGSNGPDVIVGTDGPDVIMAGNGADVIHALGGDDIVCGGNGPDVVRGGEGDDLLFGGNGTDELIDDLGSNEIDHGLGSPTDLEEISNRP